VHDLDELLRDRVLLDHRHHVDGLAHALTDQELRRGDVVLALVLATVAGALARLGDVALTVARHVLLAAALGGLLLTVGVLVLRHDCSSIRTVQH